MWMEHTPDTHFEDTSLDCGEEGDDDDNIAFQKILGSLKDTLNPPPLDDPGGGEVSLLSDKVFVHSVPNAGKQVSVKAMKHEGNLFVHLSTSKLELSKECLISLLEYAEETLQCHYAFLFLDRSIPESSRKKVLRDFRFLGFELLGPSHNKLPVRSEEYIFMGYEINPGDGSDSDED